jgi:alkylation response protein AidB-like acyl-CoA dehydrogenase
VTGGRGRSHSGPEAGPSLLVAPPLLVNAAEAVSAASDYATAIADGVIERDRAGAARVPVDELALYDRSGLLAITLPDGPNLPVSVMAEVCATVAAVDPAIAQAPQGHFLFVDVISAFGTEQQKQRLLGDVQSGRRLANALAERGGSHAQDLKTRLTGAWQTEGSERTRPGGAAPRLNGHKYYATGALTAHWIAVSALDETDRLIIAFVEREADGVLLDTDWNVMGQRATISGSVRFEDVAVDPELVLDYAQCFEVPQQLGARAQLYHAAIEVGIARGVIRDARWFVTEKARPFFEATRAGWASAASEDPHVIHRFGVMATRVEAADALLARAGSVLDSIGLFPASAEAAARGSIAVAQAKAFAGEVAVEVAAELFSLSGASAADEKYDLGRHWRNARTHSAHDPADWKYHHAGNWLLNGVAPPNHGQI